MLFYLILGIIFIIITLFAIIKIKFSFWTKQPVFHYYNLLYWIYPPGLITDFFPMNKYVNFTNITIYSIDNIPPFELKKYYYFIRAYYHNYKTAKYLPSKKYIISPLEANNYPSHILLYKEPKLLIENNKAVSHDFISNDYISEDTIVGGLSVRILNIKVDNNSFESEMESSKKLARANWKGSGDKSVEEKWFKVREELQPTEFLGLNVFRINISCLNQRDSIPQQIT